MSAQTELDDRMTGIRTQMLLHMAQPITLAEVAGRMDMTVQKLYTHVVALESCSHSIKYLQKLTYKLTYKGVKRSAYQALRADYELPPRIYKQLPKTQIEGGRYIRFDDNSKESKSLADKLCETQQMRNAQPLKQNVWIGSTAGMV
jgi:hypothetical protein